MGETVFLGQMEELRLGMSDRKSQKTGNIAQ
jgi:hypothetical protein